MASKALIDLSYSAALGNARILLARDLLRHHVEVHHVVARWSLVALRAVDRIGRGMLELGQRPLRGCMTARALGAKQADMFVFGGVAHLAIERHLEGAHARVIRRTSGARGVRPDPASELSSINTC